MLIIPIHDIHIGTKKKNIKKWLNRFGEQGVRDLIEVKRADKLGQNPLKPRFIKSKPLIKKDDQEVGGDPFYTDKQLKAQAAAEANAWTQSQVQPRT